MEEYNDEVVNDTDDDITETDALFLGILLSNQHLFENLFRIYRNDSDKTNAKDAALKAMSKEAHRLGMDLESYFDLLKDFSHWILDVSNIQPS